MSWRYRPLREDHRLWITASLMVLMFTTMLDLDLRLPLFQGPVIAFDLSTVVCDEASHMILPRLTCLTAADTHFKFSIDNHTFTVIQTDFVPIVPYETTMVSIGMGQRYDIIVNATEATAGMWRFAFCPSFSTALGMLRGQIRTFYLRDIQFWDSS